MIFIRFCILILVGMYCLSCVDNREGESTEKSALASFFSSKPDTDPEAKPTLARSQKNLHLTLNEYAAWIEAQEGITHAKAVNDSNEVTLMFKPTEFEAGQSASLEGVLTKASWQMAKEAKAGYAYYWIQLLHKNYSAQTLKYGSQKTKMQESVFFVVGEDTLRNYIIEEFKYDIAGKPIDYLVLLPGGLTQTTRMVFQGKSFGLEDLSLYIDKSDINKLPKLKIQ